MNKDRKILLIILYFSLLASLSGLNLFFFNERKSEVHRKIALLEEQYGKAGLILPNNSEKELAVLEDQIINMEERFAPPEKRDTFDLGQTLIKDMERSGITVSEYRTIEEDDRSYLEFTVNSSSFGFFRFIEGLSNDDFYYSVPYVSIRNEKNGIRAVFRLGFAIYE